MCPFTFVATASIPHVEEGKFELLVDSGCSSHMVDPAMNPNAEQHLREYQALQPPQVGVGSHGIFITGTAMLKVGLQNTDNIQRELNMAVFLLYLASFGICGLFPQH